MWLWDLGYLWLLDLDICGCGISDICGCGISIFVAVGSRYLWLWDLGYLWLLGTRRNGETSQPTCGALFRCLPGSCSHKPQKLFRKAVFGSLGRNFRLPVAKPTHAKKPKDFWARNAGKPDLITRQKSLPDWVSQPGPAIFLGSSA